MSKPILERKRETVGAGSGNFGATPGKSYGLADSDGVVINGGHFDPIGFNYDVSICSERFIARVRLGT